MPAITQLLRFTLPRSSTCVSAFRALRERVSSKASAKMQYFGYVFPNEGFPIPKPADDMCWLIHWPQNSSLRDSKEFEVDLANVAEGTVRSLLFEFQETKDGELEKGLDAPACQFAIINLALDAPRSRPDFERSMHKTFTDCYFAPGFTGGGWAYALNSNDAGGEVIGAAKNDAPMVLSQNERRLAYYCIGWETVELHHAFARTPLFDEEIDKLKGWFGSGTGDFYVHFERHT